MSFMNFFTIGTSSWVGHTGMTPAQFRDAVWSITAKVGLDPGRIVLGGDHLGPNPLPARDAMDKACAMIAAYAGAGFTKLHLDTSMGCKGEAAALGDRETAEHTARLAGIAEKSHGGIPPVYAVGTEVLVPVGATHALDHLALTIPDAVDQTYAVHHDAFGALGLLDALARVIALMVQPGVEFGHADVIPFDADRAAALSGALGALPGVVFEAHSTDYQTAPGLCGFVTNGFAILKVGPWLTFALREALYALDAMADALDGQPPRGGLMAEMEAIMGAGPMLWQSHHSGSTRELWLQHHFSYSDRFRYYWPDPRARAAVARLRAVCPKAGPTAITPAVQTRGETRQFRYHPD